jgi:hypothetical protein
MPTEVFISYFTYYSAALLWGFYIRRMLFPLICLALIWHYTIYRAIIGATDTAKDRLADAEYGYWLPLTILLGVYAGRTLTVVRNFKRVVFTTNADEYGCWLPVVIVNFISMQAVLGIWETSGTLEPPVNYWVTFAIQITLIILWYLITRVFTIWGYNKRVGSENVLAFDDFAAEKFRMGEMVLVISTTLIFAIFQGAFPNLWPFWLVLAVFGFHLIIIGISRAFSGGGRSFAEGVYTNAREKVMIATGVSSATGDNVYKASTRKISEGSELQPLTNGGDLEDGTEKVL